MSVRDFLGPTHWKAVPPWPVAPVVTLHSAGLFIDGGDGAPPSKALPCVIPGESFAFFDDAANLLPHFNHDLVRHGL